MSTQDHINKAIKSVAKAMSACEARDFRALMLIMDQLQAVSTELSCEHGKGPKDYCLPCFGRING